MEIVTCLGCGRDGSLLVCHQNGCGFAVHEKCLPCSAYFDDFGCYYCPQCSYERAVEECDKAKKHASLAKEALLKFISAPGGNVQQPEVEATDGKLPSSEKDVINLARAGVPQEKEDSVMCKKTCSPDSLLEEHCVNEHNPVLFPAEVDAGNNSRKTMDCLVHPGTSVESEKTKNLDNKKTHTEPYIAPNQGKQTREFAASVKHTSTSQNCGTDKLHTFELRERKIKHHTRQISVQGLVERAPDADSDEADAGGVAQPQVLPKTDNIGRPYLMEKSHDTVMGVVNDLPNISIATKQKKQTDEILEESDGKDKLYVEESDISDSDLGTTINKRPNVNRRQKGKRAKYFLRSSNNSDIQNVNAYESVEGRHSRELATESPKKSFINSKNLAKHPTTGIKRRINWTAEEVEILKKGVQKFHVPPMKMPWSRILEYGSEVFDHSRTAGDLKDKWRNLNK
ncbi:hypothetical protein QQ045_010582 [Rhodiola kirilowii]